ncbi:MAG: cob(I)yrinic acid a,c-diamide adenosyltransferase [Defluviitaleaceae bacterium]|nr:cob(I)yrinic acid a,c-diamide adenosyltransferase [Defluviitaleaceae bacterium]
MKIYTKQGDGGKTTLLDPAPVSKHDDAITAMGAIDELISYLGLVKVNSGGGLGCAAAQDAEFIGAVQKKLFSLCAHIADRGNPAFRSFDADTAELERRMDAMQAEMLERDAFAPPGTCELSAHVDIARAICRRAETRLSALNSRKPVSPEAMGYINRLSDYLYMLARYADFVYIVRKIVSESIETEKGGSAAPEYARPGLADAKKPDCAPLGLADAEAVIARVAQKAAEMGVCVAVAATGPDGQPIAARSMDGAYPISFDLALKKAYTAAVLKMPTHELQKLTKPGGEFYGLEAGGKVTGIGGGFPVLRGGKLAGAIGVSGGSAAEDAALAKFGAENA